MTGLRWAIARKSKIVNKQIDCMVQTLWYHFGIGAPILVYFSGDWDVHWGYGVLTHGRMTHMTPTNANGSSPQKKLHAREKQTLGV